MGLDQGGGRTTRGSTKLLLVARIARAQAAVLAPRSRARVGGRTTSERPAWPMPSALRWLESNALYVAALAPVAALSLARIPDDLNQDGWLGLVAGRYVAHGGVPHHDYFNVLTHGTRWIDQQWLAQWAIYALHQAGGMALYCIAYVGLVVGGLAMAIAAARKLGAAERHVLWVLPFTGFLYFAGSFQIRTQGFAYPLFAGTLWLLASEVRAPTRRRVYLVFPLLVLWGNLHGSVTMGVGLASLYGITLLFFDLRAGWHRRRPQIGRRTLAFLIGPALCLLLTPYGLSIIGYYKATILNPGFSKLVTEWQPVTSIAVIAIPFFGLTFAIMWLLGRSGRRTPLFYHLALVVLAIGGVFAVRNITWFGLAVLILVPGLLSQLLPARGHATRRPAVNLSLALVALVMMLGAAVAVAAKPPRWFERGYDQRALASVAAFTEHHPGARIFSDVRFSDWLLWHDPSLAGRIAYDIRFELLTKQQLVQIAGVANAPTSKTKDLLAPYSLLVLDPNGSQATQMLLDRTAAQVILRGRRVVLATRQPSP